MSSASTRPLASSAGICSLFRGPRAALTSRNTHARACSKLSVTFLAYSDPAYGRSVPTGLVHFDDHPVQFAAMPRGFHANRHLGEKLLEDDILVHANHRLIRPGHPHVGLVRGPVVQNSCIGGRDVSVRADDGGHAPVQIPNH